MFCYFGSKGKIAQWYPKPEYPLIIEPFAGSARYALHHWQGKDVLLNDYNWRIAMAWDWLVKATDKDIDALPDMKPYDSIDDFDITLAQRNILSCSCNRGRVFSRRLTGWAAKENEITRFKKRAKANVHKIRNWKATNLDYRELPNSKATWFIDPPYRRGGEHYGTPALDYRELGDWCRSREGQVIVCENEFHGDWLPFRSLGRKGKNATFSASGRFHQEMIWTNGSVL